MATGIPPERRRWRLGVWGVFFLGCGLLLLLMIVACIAMMVRASNRVDAELAAIQETGQPATAEDLQAYYRLPDGVVNTAELWMRATMPMETAEFNTEVQDLPIVGNNQKEIPPPGQPWEDLEAVEALLEKYRKQMDLLYEAAEKGPAAQYPNDFSKGISMLLPHIQALRSGARMLQLEAHVCAHRGDPEGAAKAIRTMIALAQSMEREPVLVSLLVRIACNGIAVGQIRTLLRTTEFSDEDLRSFQTCLRSVDLKEGAYQAMLGERVMGIQTMQDPSAMGMSPMQSRLARLVFGGSLTVYLEHMDRTITATQLPWPELLDETQLAEDELNQIVNQGSPITRARYAMLALLCPALNAAYSAAARGTALNAAADVAIAVEQYRRRHGEVPENLQQLVPEFLPAVPMDPFDGQALRYVVEEDGYFIYSVGRDRTDNGGLDDGRYEPDMAYRIGPPEEVDQTDASGQADEPSESDEPE